MKTDYQIHSRRYSTDELTHLLNAWYEEQGIEPLSADEYLHDEALSKDQRDWITRFCAKWDESQSREDGVLVVPPGWECQSTGGGCTAWFREAGEFHWMLTRDEDPYEPNDPDAPCVLGIYDNEDTNRFLQWHCSCLAEALQIAEGAKTL